MMMRMEMSMDDGYLPHLMNWNKIYQGARTGGVQPYRCSVVEYSKVGLSGSKRVHRVQVPDILNL